MIIYLDTVGNVLKKVGFGKHHNADLKVLDFVERNRYENSQLTQTVKYITDYENNISAKYKTIYIYNKNNQLTKEVELDYATDTVATQYDYQYDSSGNCIRTQFDQTIYQRTFDSQLRIRSLQQFHNNKLHWGWTYTYTDTARIGEFKTYYSDGRNYTKSEEERYRNGRLISVEEKYTNEEGLSEKKVLHYDQLGLITRIDFLQASSADIGYRYLGYTEIKTEFCQQLNPEMSKEINATILED